MQGLCNSILSVNSINREYEPNFFRLFRFLAFRNRIVNLFFRFSLFCFGFGYFGSVLGYICPPLPVGVECFILSSSHISECHYARVRGWSTAPHGHGPLVPAPPTLGCRSAHTPCFQCAAARGCLPVGGSGSGGGRRPLGTEPRP